MSKYVYVILIMSMLLTGSALWGQDNANDQNLIQMAIMLDTSNSMDGLIDQAKSQLWKIVNELALSRKNGKIPKLEVALYEYGNNSISVEKNYVRLVSGFTTDLDMISEELFNLTTNGGDEYCGAVINYSLKELKWSSRNDVLKVIFIAGNEPFSQGPVPYSRACSKAISKGIIVNTIYCGSSSSGEAVSWKDGALLADGKFMTIDQDQAIVYIEAPQDAEIMKLNEQLNETYIAYGAEGRKKKMLQEKQDSNAQGMNTESMVQRSVTKSTENYKNSSWDLVDAVEEEEIDLGKLEKDKLPEEMKNMSVREREAYVKEKTEERAKLQARIQKLNEERRKYVEAEKQKISTESTLDEAIIETIREQAEEKDYNFTK